MGRSEYLVNVFAEGPKLHTPAHGLGTAYPDQISDLLAAVEANTANSDFRSGLEEFEANLTAHLSQITLMVCVFQDWDLARQALVERLREYGTGLKVVIVRDTPCTLPPGDLHVLTSAQIAAGVDEI